VALTAGDAVERVNCTWFQSSPLICWTKAGWNFDFAGDESLAAKNGHLTDRAWRVLGD